MCLDNLPKEKSVAVINRTAMWMLKNSRSLSLYEYEHNKKLWIRASLVPKMEGIYAPRIRASTNCCRRRVPHTYAPTRQQSPKGITPRYQAGDIWRNRLIRGADQWKRVPPVFMQQLQALGLHVCQQTTAYECTRDCVVACMVIYAYRIEKVYHMQQRATATSTREGTCYSIHTNNTDR